MVEGSPLWVGTRFILTIPTARGQRLCNHGNRYRTRVTEPGGRYLQFFYGPAADNDGTILLTRVEAHALGNATVTDWVHYSYTSVSPGVQNRNKMMLTGVNYSDGTSASYQYCNDNVHEGGGTKGATLCSSGATTCVTTGQKRGLSGTNTRAQGRTAQFCGKKILASAPFLRSLRDLRSSQGVPSMRRGGMARRAHSLTVGLLVSAYTTLEGCDICDNIGTDGPDQQAMLLSYKDFQGNTTQLGYDPKQRATSLQLLILIPTPHFTSGLEHLQQALVRSKRSRIPIALIFNTFTKMRGLAKSPGITLRAS